MSQNIFKSKEQILAPPTAEEFAGLTIFHIGTCSSVICIIFGTIWRLSEFKYKLFTYDELWALLSADLSQMGQLEQAL